MKIATVNFSDIMKHPTKRMDADYHVGKANGKKAYTKKDKGQLVEDDINGKIILSDSDAKKYNETKSKINELTESISDISQKVK